MKSYFDLTGQVAVVTGCSTGLGVQMAHALANQGCKIVALARRQEKIDAVAKELHDTYGVETLAVRCDITDTQMVQDAVKAVMDHFGRIDILINNAGTGAVAPAEEITDDQFSNELNIDLFGTFKMAREVARAAMIPAKYGRIINIASLQSSRAFPNGLPYGASKGGIAQLTRGMAEAWSRPGTGITANAIAPGFFKTQLTAPLFDKPEVVEALARQTTMNRVGFAEDIQGLTMFLASPASGYITGQVIHIDGGWTAI